MSAFSFPRLEKLTLARVRFTVKNPRQGLATTPDPDLPALAASLGTEEAPTLTQYPLVEEVEPGVYRVVAGERRARAALFAGWQTMPCLVMPPLPPLEAHHLRVLENLHRKEVGLLDLALALKVTWYARNAQARGVPEKTLTALLAEEVPSGGMARGLENLLAAHGFDPAAPPVTWDELLDGFGLAFDAERRQHLRQVLEVTLPVQTRLRTLAVELSEAHLRALAMLEPEAQLRLGEALAAHPPLVRKIGRIVHAVRGHGYTLEEALTEAQASLLDTLHEHPEEEETFEGPSASEAEGYNLALAEQVLGVMESLQTWRRGLKALLTDMRPLTLHTLPSPWQLLLRDALQETREDLENLLF
jgi:hypothetical protein